MRCLVPVISVVYRLRIDFYFEPGQQFNVQSGITFEVHQFFVLRVPLVIRIYRNFCHDFLS